MIGYINGSIAIQQREFLMSGQPVLNDLKPVVALCKRRGFIFPGSEIYGGFANTYSYGPYGALLKKRIKDLWWKTFVDMREDMLGMDGPILLHPKVWEASGHLSGFNDALVDCKNCKARLRADHLIEQSLGRDMEGVSVDLMSEILQSERVSCPKCGKHDWTAVRHFNLMFKTQLSKTSEDQVSYLRPETAQAIFADFKQIIDTMRVQVPFGLAQIGKAFRNEITPGNFIFRTIEFEQMEIEYFVHPAQWQQSFERWLADLQNWCALIGLKPESISLLEHKPEKLSHYSKRTVDILYKFPFGDAELYGLAYRTDFDLSAHAAASKTNLSITDTQTGEKYIPHVIEPSLGLDRTILAVLCDAYCEEELPSGDKRTVLRLSPKIAPCQIAVLPLMRKPELIELARSIYHELLPFGFVQYDDGGAIGKRYRRQDEIGTPACITIDYDSLTDGSVTWRDRDTMQQERIPRNQLVARLLAMSNSVAPVMNASPC